MIFKPNYRITQEILECLTKIEMIKNLFRDSNISPVLLASLKSSAKIETIHYSTKIEGNRLTRKEVEQTIFKRKVIENRVRDSSEVKSYYKAMPAYLKNPERFTGRPQKPGYLDPKEGRGWLVITSQNFTREEDGFIRMPGFLKGISIKARHSQIRQIRIRTERACIRILLVYEKKEVYPTGPAANTKVMGVDLGVNNLITAVWTSDESPVIISGKPLKSINQFYNRKKAALQAAARKGNGRRTTRRIDRLTRKRNRKAKDMLHKASRKIVDLAEETGAGVIIIGNNKGWKQNVNLGNRTNQNFVAIPHLTLIEMIRYKAALLGIEVRIVEEAYTSGTSYLDGEIPTASFYNRARRIHRGLFRSNAGIYINADVNAAYQILKVGGITDLKIKQAEPVRKIKAA